MRLLDLVTMVLADMHIWWMRLERCSLDHDVVLCCLGINFSFPVVSILDYFIFSAHPKYVHCRPVLVKFGAVESENAGFSWIQTGTISLAHFAFSILWYKYCFYISAEGYTHPRMLEFTTRICLHCFFVIFDNLLSVWLSVFIRNWPSV